MIFFRGLSIAAIAVLSLCLPTSVALGAQPGIYASFDYQLTLIAGPPEFEPEVTLSISEAHTVLPPLRRSRASQPYVVSASWPNRTVKVAHKFYKEQAYVPMTFDGYSFLDWRRESERRKELRAGSFDQIRASKNSGPGGLRVSIPIKSKTFESLFGEGGAGLQVSGSRRISFAGNSNWSDRAATSASAQSRFPTLQMDQSFQFDIVGTIGSKIFVKVNQDSRVSIPLANRLEIRFNGGEDDVIQKIEAGNTTLSLPGASLLRYSSSVRGLFGIKTEAQLGPIKFVGIASQEKANTERASITSGASARTVTVRDYSYDEYRMFDLGVKEAIYESPDDSIIDFELYKTAKGGSNVLVFDSAVMYFDPRLDANGDVADSSEKDGGSNGDPVDRIAKEDYTIFSRQRTLIFEQQGRKPLKADNLGVWLKMRRANPADPRGPTYEIGNVDNAVVKLLWLKKRVADSTSIIDTYEHRNIYRLPNSLGIDWDSPDIDAIDLKVVRGNDKDEDATTSLSNQDGVEYIQVLGLDQISSSQAIPDGKADFTSSLFDFQRRIVIFPHRRPFDSDTAYGTTDTLNVKAPGIYNPVRSGNRSEDSRYFLLFESRVRTNAIQLSGANIVDGSVVVRNGSETLVEGTDYNVVGNSVQLISDNATDPAADITVDYGVAPLFTVEKKTLLGARFEYQGSKNFQLGLTTLFKSDKATTRKPKVGQETSKMFAWDLSSSLRVGVNPLTSWFNKLPLLNVKGNSSISLQGEIARSNPNPNVDGEAYIDDFEGARRKIDLGIRRNRWMLSSRPVQIEPLTTNRASSYWYNPDDDHNVLLQDVFNQESKSGAGLKPLNYVFMPEKLKVDTIVIDSFFTMDSTMLPPDLDIGPDSILAIDTTRDSVLEMLYHNSSAVEIANSEGLRLEATDTSSAINNWAGITNALQISTRDQTNAELLEIRLRIRRNPFRPTGYMHFDFGEVSEDVITNGGRDVEGRDNFIYDEVDGEWPEDIGIDHRDDVAEKLWYADVLGFLPNQEDPQQDNFPYGSGDRIITPDIIDLIGNVNDASGGDELQRLKRINGTENNFYDGFIKVDAENPLDIGTDFNTTNNYFSFKASLDTAATEHNFFVPGSEGLSGDTVLSGLSGFITIRIPIQDVRAIDTIIGDPSWSNIKHVRMWFDSLSDTTMIEIAAIDIVSSNWEDTLLVMSDSTRLAIDSLAVLPTVQSQFLLSVINTSEDKISYIVPPGVSGNFDPVNQITEPEQSLRLAYENFIFGDTGKITKPQTAINYMGYRELRMFVHGDTSMQPSEHVNFYYRLGTDSLNYYEFRTRLEPGWSSSNEVVMDFNELTALKDQGIKAELIDVATDRLNTRDLDPIYRVVGLPTLRSVRYMSSGITNGDISDVNLGISGEVWVDELRLSNVRRDAGTALRLSANGNIGDFISSYSASVSYTDAFYRDIARGTRRGSGASLGSGSSDLRYSLSASFQIAKFLPPSMKASIPIRLSYSKSVRTPLLVTANNSDIVLPEERRIEERTITESRGFSIRESFKKNTKNLLYSVLLNRVKSSFDYNRSVSVSPTVPRSLTERYSASLDYDVARFPEAPSIPIFFMFSRAPLLKRLSETKLNLSPTNLRIRNNFARSLNVRTLNQEGDITSSHSRTLNTDIQTGARWLTNLSSRLSIKIQSDLRDPDWINLSFSNLRLGKITRLQQSFNHEFSPKLFAFLTHKFSFNSSYTENRKQGSLTREYVEANPEDSLLEPFDVSQNLRFSVSGNFDLQKFLGEPGSVSRMGAASDSRRRNQERAKKLREDRQRRASGDTLSVDSLQVDSTGVDAEAEDSGPGGPWLGSRVYNLSRSGLKKVTSFIDPFTVSLDKNQSMQRNGLRNRPGSIFRFGLGNGLTDTVVTVSRQTDSESRSMNWRLGSGAKFFGGGISARVDISESKSTSLPSVGAGSESTDRSMPRLTINIREFRSFDNVWGLRFLQGQLNAMIRRFKPQTAYARRTTERIDLSDGSITSRTEVIDRGPLLGVTIPIKRALNVTGRYETGASIRDSFRKGGELSSSTKEENKTLRLSTQYSFRSPGGIRLPLFGRLKLNSTVSMKLDVLKRLNETIKSGGDGNVVSTEGRETFTVNMNINYSFSTQVRGGMTTTWTDTKSVSRSTHTREVRIFAEMRF